MRTRETITTYEVARAQWGGVAAGSLTASSAAPSSSKVTKDSTYTGWNTRNALLKDPRQSPRTKRIIRMQDYGGQFVSEEVGLWTNYSWDDWTTPSASRYVYGYGSVKYNGTYYYTPWSPDYPTYEAQYLDALGFGGNAIRTTAPTKERAGLSVFLGELREGLPSLAGASLLRSRSLRSAARSSGSEYLNWQFGVMPLVTDLRQLATSVTKSETILRQLRRDSDRPVRRRLHLPSVVSSGQERNNFIPTPALNTYLYDYLDTHKQGIRTWVRTDDRWFSGEFRYHWPVQGDTLLDRVKDYSREARVLLGASLDPSTAWELTRFSWLVDWFVDIGGFLDGVALTSQDGLVMPRAYAMSKVRYEENIASRTKLCGQAPFRQTRWAERKMRVKASPYGFDVGWEGLTAFQTSILSALGLSKEPISLLRNPRRIH